LARSEKEETIRLLAEKLSSYSTTFVADYQGLDVETITELRRKLSAAEVEFRVVKNTLAGLAADAAGISDLKALLKGPTACVFSHDPVIPSKILIEFSKAHPELKLKGGVLDKVVLTADEAMRLATLPSLQTLQVILVTRLKAPLYVVVSMLASPLRAVVYVVDEIRKQKEAEAVVQTVEQTEGQTVGHTVEEPAEQAVPQAEEGS
jgi:large subunit ribosomal protein L10